MFTRRYQFPSLNPDFLDFDFDASFKEIDQLFSITKRTLTKPAEEQMNVKENMVTIHLPVPGFKKNELRVQVDENTRTLIISGEIGSGDGTPRFDAKKFVKKFYLQRLHCYERITSKLEDGVLTVQVPVWNSGQKPSEAFTIPVE